LIESIDFLFTCADEWDDPMRSLKMSVACILEKLRALSAREQRMFNYLLYKLLSNSWPVQDRDLGRTGDFEISAAIWAMRIGPRCITNGMAGGLSTPEILKDVEEEWMFDHVGRPDFDTQIVVLKALAKDLSV
jgi:hypothetical protein